MISFIIAFHTSRICDLLQTLHFLRQREPVADWEVVLVCQDRTGTIETGFGRTVLLNMDFPSYRKPIMLNTAVRASANPIIAVLDSDRILPKGYFANLAASLKPRQVVTTIPLFRMKRPYTNEEIERGQFEVTQDYRSPVNAPGKKNLFSGNTVMWREDYLACGGMDEHFEGYGFHDTDMTTTVLAAGLTPTYLDMPEYHLDHPRAVTWDGVPFTELPVMLAINANRYCRKWNVYNHEIEKRNLEIMENIHLYPVLGPEFQAQQRVYKIFL